MLEDSILQLVEQKEDDLTSQLIEQNFINNSIKNCNRVI